MSYPYPAPPFLPDNPRPELREAVAAYLRQDVQLGAWLTGGIHATEELVPPLNWNDPEEWSTPLAFDSTTGAIKPCANIVIRGPGTLFTGTPRVQGGVFAGATTEKIEVWVYQAKPRRDIIDRAKWRIIDLLDSRVSGKQFDTWREGRGVHMRLSGYLGDNLGDPDLFANLERIDFRAALDLLGVV